MSQDRRDILDLLAEGRITAAEAERLLAALEPAPSRPDEGSAPRPGRAKYLRVLVEAHDGRSESTRVNVRVPMQLLRAGVRLSSVIPVEARDRVNAAMREKGMALDLNQLRPENLEELVDQLNDLTVDVDGEDAKVRVFCE